MEQELHISGIVVFTRPADVQAVSACVKRVPFATIHASSPDGKLIVTLETDSAARTLDCMDAIRAAPGVLDVALVYQHAEPLQALEQEIQP